MKAPGIPANEQKRIEALYKYNILDTLPQKDFDDITKLASEICNTPIAHVSLVDANRVWLKSAIGIDVGDVKRNESFCAHTIVDLNDVMTVPDSSKDERFFDNPYVTGDPNIVFYAGVPLVTDDGYSIGTLCVLDRTPRELTERQKETLKALSNQIVRLLELNLKTELLEKNNKQLERFSYVVAHDLKSPLTGIYSVMSLLKDDDRITSQPDLDEYFDLITKATEHLSGMIGSLLDHAKSHNSEATLELVDTRRLVLETVSLLFPPSHIRFEIHENLPTLHTNKLHLFQVFQNLLSNAIKYNDKKDAVIEVGAGEAGDFYKFYVKDNGQGIADRDQEKVFKLFTTTDNKSSTDSSTGVGLNMLKVLVEGQGGKLWVESKKGKGSCFFFEWRK